MTGTGTAIRRMVAVVSAIAAVAALGLVADLTPATASADTSVSQAAKVKAATSKKTKASPRDSVVRTTARAAGTTASATDFTSIFAAQQPAYTNAGWASCPSAISWTVDTSELSAAEADRQIANLQASFAQWAEVSGLTFSFAGTATFRYDETAFTLTRTDGAATPSRSINLAFVDDAESDLLGGTTVGLAGPTTVWANSKVIESGTGVFRTDAVKKMSDAQAQALFTHELGHVLGLGHAAEDGNIMYPVVSSARSLGAGDVAGVQTMVKPCAA